MAENQIKLLTIEDVWNEIDKQILIDCTKKYDPQFFWDDFGDKYLKSFKRIQEIQHNVGWLIEKMKILKVDSVLDAGCGFGRVIPFLLDGEACKEITGIDISQKQLDSAQNYLFEVPDVPNISEEEKEKFKQRAEEFKKKVKLFKGSIRSLPFEKESFDLILSSECLSYTHPPKVPLVLTEFRRVTRKYVILLERFIFAGEHPQPHLWSHNYSKLVEDRGFKILESSVVPPAVLRMILKK